MQFNYGRRHDHFRATFVILVMVAAMIITAPAAFSHQTSGTGEEGDDADGKKDSLHEQRLREGRGSLYRGMNRIPVRRLGKPEALASRRDYVD
jgi:hypothetical protein